MPLRNAFVQVTLLRIAVQMAKNTLLDVQKKDPTSVRLNATIMTCTDALDDTASLEGAWREPPPTRDGALPPS